MRHGDWVNCFAFNPSGELLASGSDDHLAVIWDIERGEKIRVIHGDWLSSHVSFSPCSRFLAITYPYSWSIFCMPCDDIVEEQLNRDRIVSIVFSPDDVSLAVGTWKRALLFNLVSQCVILVLPHSDMVNVLAFSPDGRYLASSDSRTIMIWSLRTGNVTSTSSLYPTGFVFSNTIREPSIRIVVLYSSPYLSCIAITRKTNLINHIKIA